LSEDCKSELATLKADLRALGEIGKTREKRFTDWCNGLDQNQKDSDTKWDKRIQRIEQDLASRLPTWATIAIAVLTAALGWAIGR